jgi:EcsC protein family
MIEQKDNLAPVSSPTPTPYELRALRRCAKWKTAGPPRSAKLWKAARKPLTALGASLFRVPGVGKLIDTTTERLVGYLGDAAHFSIRADAVFADLAKSAATPVGSLDEVRALPLKQIDRAMRGLRFKYEALAAAEGAATGVIGFWGVPADIVAVVALNLRAVGEIATYYGFDFATQPERLFALHVLTLAVGADATARQVEFTELDDLARRATGRRAWQELEQSVFNATLRRVARMLGGRMARAKLAQFLPAVSLAIAGGFNAFYTRDVCQAASHLYRERFLIAKYATDPAVAPLPAGG